MSAYCQHRTDICVHPQLCAASHGCTYTRPTPMTIDWRSRQTGHNETCPQCGVSYGGHQHDCPEERRNQPITRGEILDVLDGVREHVSLCNVGPDTYILLDTLRRAFE